MTFINKNTFWLQHNTVGLGISIKSVFSWANYYHLGSRINIGSFSSLRLYYLTFYCNVAKLIDDFISIDWSNAA